MVLRDPRGSVPRPSASRRSDPPQLSPRGGPRRLVHVLQRRLRGGGQAVRRGPLGAYTLAFTDCERARRQDHGAARAGHAPGLRAVQDNPGGGEAHVPRRRARRWHSSRSRPRWGSAALAPELVPFAFGEKWTDAVMPLVLLCAGPPRSGPSHRCSLDPERDRAIAVRDAESTSLPWLVMPVSFFAASRRARGVAAVWILVYPLLVLPAATSRSPPGRADWPRIPGCYGSSGPRGPRSWGPRDGRRARPARRIGRLCPPRLARRPRDRNIPRRDVHVLPDPDARLLRGTEETADP